ncbi:RNA-directed DNA polymerase, eukaryota [Tanacetum coccineum]
MNWPHPTSQHPNSKNLHHISITIFVTNFPTTVSSKDLWKLCDRARELVADVRSHESYQNQVDGFGFVSFHQKPDQVNILEDLNKKSGLGVIICFFNCTLRPQTKAHARNQSHQKQSNNTKPHETGHASHTTGGRSYASVLNGKEGTQKPVLAGPITKNITLENSDLLELSDTFNVVLGQSSDESRLKFQKNTEMELYFTQRKLVSHNFIPDERRSLIEIDGRHSMHGLLKHLKKIAENGGETIL